MKSRGRRSVNGPTNSGRRHALLIHEGGLAEGLGFAVAVQEFRELCRHDLCISSEKVRDSNALVSFVWQAGKVTIDRCVNMLLLNSNGNLPKGYMMSFLEGKHW